LSDGVGAAAFAGGALAFAGSPSTRATDRFVARLYCVLLDHGRGRVVQGCDAQVGSERGVFPLQSPLPYRGCKIVAGCGRHVVVSTARAPSQTSWIS
jgi:hypothetical protein